MPKAIIASLLALTILAIASPANARTSPVSQPSWDRHDVRGSFPIAAVDTTAPVRVKRTKHYRQHRDRVPRNYASHKRERAVASIAEPTGDLVAKARAYLGTNPTGWSRVWCGKFMAMIAPEAARRISNPNLARAWADLPRTAPRVGAIVVLSRGKGGHVGVVAGFEPSGNPIVISGNHNRRVGIGRYSRNRVIAYVDS